MAEIHGIFVVFSNVNVAYRGSEWDGRWSAISEVGCGGRGRVGGCKTQIRAPLEKPLYPHNGPCHISMPQRQWEQS